jgi:hypothetical protein
MLVESLFYNYVIALILLCSISTKVLKLTSVCLTKLQLFWLIIVAEIHLFFKV